MASAVKLLTDIVKKSRHVKGYIFSMLMINRMRLVAERLFIRDFWSGHVYPQINLKWDMLIRKWVLGNFDVYAGMAKLSQEALCVECV